MALFPLHVVAGGECPFDVTCSFEVRVGAMTAENDASRTAAGCDRCALVGDVTAVLCSGERLRGDLGHSSRVSSKKSADPGEAGERVTDDAGGRCVGRS